MTYISTCGPSSGPLRYAAAPDVMPVVRSRSGHATIGRAERVGRDLSGVAVWRLTIDGTELPEVWIVIDREFRRME